MKPAHPGLRHAIDLETGLHLSDLSKRKRPYWLNFDYKSSHAKQWFETESKLDPLVIEALFTEDIRPRAIRFGEGILISLRGVNHSPDAQPEDMVSIRIWLEHDRVITTQRRHLKSINDLVSQLESMPKPIAPETIIVQLIENLIYNMADTIDELDETLFQIEDQSLLKPTQNLRDTITYTRRQIISLRRHLVPQREVLAQLQSEKTAQFSTTQKQYLRESHEHLQRYVEELEAMKDRTMSAQEDLSNSLDMQINKRMYVLSVITAIFLPLGFLTGLLGINVGGMPGTDNDSAFYIVVGLLTLVLIGQLLLLKKQDWF